MNCRRVQPQLLDFSFGRLEAAVAGAVTAHLKGCADCRRVLRREQRTAVALGGMDAVEPRADAWLTVEAALCTAVVPRGTRQIWRHPLWWAGGLTAAAALAVGLFVPTVRPPASPEPDTLRGLTPMAAAGLGLERSSDPLVEIQRKLDRLLDRVADEGS